MTRSVLELGSYIAPAYAGMILAEQGYAVTKWTVGVDPILELNDGAEMWRWINHGKTVVARDIADLPGVDFVPQIVLDNFRPDALNRRGIDPAAYAEKHGVRWVSLRAEVGDTSFDVIAQARSWMEYGPWVPFYVGDTVAGLWMAFKALAAEDPGHYVLGHASVMQKLVERELQERPSGDLPWDPPGSYGVENGAAVVLYRGRRYSEPVRDRKWKLAHLLVDGTGRISV